MQYKEQITNAIKEVFRGSTISRLPTEVVDDNYPLKSYYVAKKFSCIDPEFDYAKLAGELITSLLTSVLEKIGERHVKLKVPAVYGDTCESFSVESDNNFYVRICFHFDPDTEQVIMALVTSYEIEELANAA